MKISLSLYVERVKNPIWLAEKVLEHSPHCLLACEGAQRFALSQGIGLVPHESLISPDAQRAWEQFKKTPKNLDDQLLSTIEGVSNELESHDTVGAVCMDFQGDSRKFPRDLIKNSLFLQATYLLAPARVASMVKLRAE